MKKIITIAFLLISSNLIFSQENYRKCNTTQLVKEELKKNSNYVTARNNAKELTSLRLEKSIITIPIVIHIIHRTSHSNIGSGTNISNEQIEDQLRILNEDYSKTSPEYPSPPRTTFLAYWGNPDLKFCLATIDPNGNPTSGITRTSTSQTYWDADDNAESNYMKLTSQGGKNNWDPLRYLNIWVCDLTNSQGGGMTLGYAYLPGLQGTNQSWKDGLVVDYRYFGTLGVAAPSSDGRTATHEVGHYFGLNHTFCEDTDAQGDYTICCDNDNDSWWGGNVEDTPASKGIYFNSVNSATNNNTCNDLSYQNVFTTDVIDMDENFMSYASNTWMFSQGQVDLMLSTLNTSTSQGGRVNLKNSTVTVNCSGSVNIDEYQLYDFNIYPNPSNGELHINTNIRINNISIYNIVGKEVITNAKVNNNILDLNVLKNGVYFINISTNERIISKKIIITE